MKKKIFSMMVAFLMTISLCTSTMTVFAQEKVGNYGEYAYDTLKYIDKNLRERKAGSEQELKAANYIKEKLESAGYKVTVQPFEFETKKGEKVKSQNIIVTKQGDSNKEVVVGAHYDSVATAGVDDNGSGTVVNLETAIRMIDVKTPYTIKFVFFGAEEVGLKGSKAYVDSMTQDNIVYMVNMDSMLAGTYSYIYGGNYNEKTKKVENAWPVYQTMEIAKKLNLDIHLNDTKLNYDYPSPTTGNWSDHASFRDFTPYVYFEAANWELPDDPKKPEEGSSGAYETESGEVMHVPERDDLTFIENEWKDHGKNTIKKYCTLLPEMLLKLNPPINESKIVGDSRYSTAVKISNRGWENAENVVIVNSSAISDAISATPFAKYKNAPVLLTQKDKLNDETKKEITRLKAKNIYIIGGSEVVSESVISQLKSMDVNVERISGNTRYETSLEIAKKLGDVSEIAVVNGISGLSDSVSIAPVAANKNMAIVLSSPSEGTKVFSDFIKNKNIKTSYVIGKEQSISNDVANSLPNVKRLGGENRNETNAVILETFYNSKDLNNIFVAKDGIKKQDDLIDALAVGVLAEKENSPVVIVGEKLDAKQEKLLSTKNPKEVTKVGGNGNENAFNQIANMFKN
ncbi:M20/M25/M40 family metallo-hydrolase [[Clostridium] dakarense]|uniref:M20/M25/M40 family metallo-hydrolase n=1 Tax=Faecalimicrobium dakarense TaxID=1301100 RepID=UPI0004AE3C6F|nr:M20/M25/M40 family metallo-hydrolase [[Clostridium] dakarense]